MCLRLARRPRDSSKDATPIVVTQTMSQDFAVAGQQQQQPHSSWLESTDAPAGKDGPFASGVSG